MIIYQLKTALDSTSLSTQPDSYWTLSIEDAKKIVKHLKGYSKTSSEYVFYVQPIRRAVKAKKEEITIRAGGFSINRFWNILYEVAGGFENVKEVDRLAGFQDWLLANYDYSGDVGEGRDNAWLSKSSTDYNIYFESDLKKEYLQLGKMVPVSTPAW